MASQKGDYDGTHNSSPLQKQDYAFALDYIRVIVHTENALMENEKELNATVVAEGKPFTLEHRIIAALVKRLGGELTLSPAEMANVRGVSIDMSNISITLKSD